MKNITKCPECGGRVGEGYGLMGGGMGPYWLCTRKKCGWFFKQQECPVCEGIMAGDGSCPECGSPDEIKAKLAAKYPQPCRACGKITKLRTPEGRCGEICRDGAACGGEGSSP